MKIICKPWSSWDESDRSIIGKLRFRNYNGEQSVFTSLIKDPPEGLYSIVAFINNKPIGLCLINNNNAGIYIKKQYRRKGIGKKMCNMCLSKFPNATFSSHDRISQRFFSNANIQYTIDW